MAKKIDLMHQLFGRQYGKHCRDCSNFCRVWTNTRAVFKCTVYGETSSEASDWAGKYEACGQFCKPWADRPVMRLAGKNNDAPTAEPLPGQTSLFWEE